MFRMAAGSLLVALLGVPSSAMSTSPIETVSFTNSRAPRDQFDEANVADGGDQCEGGQFDYFIYSGEDGNGVSWDDGKTFCESPSGFDGNLASIHCQAEIDFIRDNLATPFGGAGQSYWIGGSRKTRGGALTWPSLMVDRSWRWSDGKAFTSQVTDSGSAWKKKEPSSAKEGCLLVKSDDTWNDAKCNKGKNIMAVCKRRHTGNLRAPAPPPATTTEEPDLKSNDEGWECRSAGKERCCYKYYNRVIKKEFRKNFRRRTWNGATSFCKRFAGFDHLKPHIVSVTSETENRFVRDLIYDVNEDIANRPVWLGARQSGIDWKWADDNKAEWDYENWRMGEPNDKGGEGEDCLQMTSPKTLFQNFGVLNGDWNDADCNKKRGWVCEFCYDPLTQTP